MSDLFETEITNIPEFSVSAISGAIKRTMEDQFSRVRVRGEVGRISKPRSGHLYLDLKDDSAVLSAIIWKGVAGKLKVKPEEGMEVFATGRITTFPGQSKYQLVIEDITPAGTGALMAMLEQRRQMFIAEGIFEETHKRTLPFLPQKIGVVTSQSGAVIRDIIHRLKDRFPSHVLLWPVSVQGTKCAKDVETAIRGFNSLDVNRPDVIIVARGGGSLEDLWGFNEEIVVRAVAASKIPVISAIGHETDTTLIDFVADKRAPTPTAAAEIAVPVRRNLIENLYKNYIQIENSINRQITLSYERFRSLTRRLPTAERFLQNHVQRFDTLSGQLPKSLEHVITIKKNYILKTLRNFSLQTLQAQFSSKRYDFDNNTKGLRKSLQFQVENKRNIFQSVRLSSHSIRRDLYAKNVDLSNVTKNLLFLIRTKHESNSKSLDSLSRMLETLSYKSTLQRGYAVVHSCKDSKLIPSATKIEDKMIIEFSDGCVDVTLPSPVKPARKNKPIHIGKQQNSLF